MEQCYSVASANVVGETFDEEVVIVHLETGNYYSLQGIAGELWPAFESGATEQQLRRQLLSRYEADEATVTRDLAQFLASLEAEKLVSRSPATTPSLPTTSLPAKLPYATPELSKFTDMQDLLLLDPIHDVDESGWPLRANGQA